MRDASNAEALVERAARELGVAIEVIDGAREATLTFRGALAGIDHVDPAGALTVVDIGGGSTEIVRGLRGAIERAVSIDVGAVRLFERHLRSDPPRREELAALVADIDRALSDAGVDLSTPLIALAGTACTIAAIALHAAGAEGVIDAARVHGATIARRELDAIAHALATRTIAERRATPGIAPGREDVIAAGALLLARIAERARAESIVASSGGVRWGLALEMLGC
jgi:exopolyphosphatase/guanosine-5'-triphosphate,3'-diphosphate pyrophosphatase